MRINKSFSLDLFAKRFGTQATEELQTRKCDPQVARFVPS